MSYNSISERCSCGATFTVQAPYSAHTSTEKWRKEHHHEFKPEPVSIPTKATITMRAKSIRLRNRVGRTQ